ncbi:hypothetical protein HY311_03390 [Candidatus Nomurabacteria bacterium]|nr:hypothetical protein [Candidatus Nomurabacteria bacterium]
MKKNLMVLSGVFFALAPIVAFAQVTINGSTTSCDPAAYAGQNATLFGLLCRIGVFLNAVVPVLIALGVVYFVWGVITFVVANDEEAKTRGRDRIIYGIIGLAVIIGMWGLVNVLKNTFFNVGNSANITLPTVPVVQ